MLVTSSHRSLISMAQPLQIVTTYLDLNPGPAKYKYISQPEPFVLEYTQELSDPSQEFSPFHTLYEEGLDMASHRAFASDGAHIPHAGVDMSSATIDVSHENTIVQWMAVPSRSITPPSAAATTSTASYGNAGMPVANRSYSVVEHYHSESPSVEEMQLSYPISDYQPMANYQTLDTESYQPLPDVSSYSPVGILSPLALSLNTPVSSVLDDPSGSNPNGYLPLSIDVHHTSPSLSPLSEEEVLPAYMSSALPYEPTLGSLAMMQPGFIPSAAANLIAQAEDYPAAQYVNPSEIESGSTSPWTALGTASSPESPPAPETPVDATGIVMNYVSSPESTEVPLSRLANSTRGLKRQPPKRSYESAESDEESTYSPSLYSDGGNEDESGPSSRKRARKNIATFEEEGAGVVIDNPVPVPNLIKKSRGRQVGIDGDRSFSCTVEGCGKSFVRAEHLKRHVRSLHTYDKPFACSHKGCKKAFSRRDNLSQHMRVHL